MDAGAVQSLLLLLLLGGLLGLVLFRTDTASGRVEGAVYVIATYLVVHSYLRNIGWQVRNAQRAINELDDLVSISKTEFQVKNLADAPGFQAGAGEIRFENVCFGYQNQPCRIFEGLTVTIRPGEKLALVGESGSGKSTFAKLLQRLYDLDSGRIVIDGQDVSRLAQESLRRAISVVPQEPILFHRTLAENISYARPEASRAEVVRAARQAHAHEFISRLDQGYETLVGERGIKLSGGERQRVAIARAILADAPILVLDEATSSLDSVTEHLIQEALTALMHGRTAVVIAHRLSTIRQVDRILVFDAGRVIEEGSHDELVRRPGGHYRKLVEMQTFSVLDESELESRESA
jgi:ATP-binding cassette subfamily B protein